jgi:hypothetical protein
VSTDLVERLRCQPVEDVDLHRLYLLVRAASLGLVHSGKYPNPWRSSWTDDDADDLTQELFTSGRHNKLVLTATDDQHLERLIRKTLGRMVIDELRKVGLAALRDRLIDVLGEGEFSKVNDMWGLPNHDPQLVYQGGVATLKGAARSVEVDVLHVRDDAKRGSSFASRDHLEALCAAVLTAAGAYVPLATLIEVVEDRLGLHASSVFEPIDDSIADRDQVPEVEIAETVDAIWQLLEADERKLIPYLDPDDTVRAVAAEVGFGRDKVSRLRRRIYEIMGEHLERHSDPERRAIIHRLVARQLACRRTESDDAALNATEPQP